MSLSPHIKKPLNSKRWIKVSYLNQFCEFCIFGISMFMNISISWVCYNMRELTRLPKCFKIFNFIYKCSCENLLAPWGKGNSESISVSCNWARMWIDLSPWRSYSKRTFYDPTWISWEKGHPRIIARQLSMFFAKDLCVLIVPFLLSF